ncbi:MAG: SUMF1/EgtB/PvdO family nonheme iron enzyme [Planctomycetales bacterium]|nr:SUMF1/EgtB/PvdO family nonheme iron enzyme [Planctomycetales bacterium]
MVIVAEGSVGLASLSPDDLDQLDSRENSQLVHVDAFYVDRFAVTNDQFQVFVDDGGYENFDLWPESVLPMVLNFVDTTGCPGPAFWANGRTPQGRGHHPVVGVSWYEAYAFARWCGKRLVNCAEWQHAATWADSGSGRHRYPWGDSFNANFANTWEAKREDTVPVDQYADGATANGIHQMVGNVWEWTDTLFEAQMSKGLRIVTDGPMAEIRGGAYDTYFTSQATCRFRSAQAIAARHPNLGFRLCLTASDLCQPNDSYAFCDQGE